MDITELKNPKKDKKSAYKSVNDKKEMKTATRSGRIRKIFCGLMCGFINGFFGGGGGMVVVPALKNLCKTDEKKAHATAVAVIFPISVLSGAVLSFGYGVEWRLLLPAAVGGSVGGIVGAFLIKILSKNVVAYVFIALMFAAGARLAFF